MSEQWLEEAKREGLGLVLQEMEFYTGRWIHEQGIPDSMAAPLGALAGELRASVLSLREVMRSAQGALSKANTKQTEEGDI